MREVKAVVTSKVGMRCTSRLQPLTAPAASPQMICCAATKVKIDGGIAIRLPTAMVMTRPQSTRMSVMKSDAAIAKCRQ